MNKVASYGLNNAGLILKFKFKVGLVLLQVLSIRFDIQTNMS